MFKTISVPNTLLGAALSVSLLLTVPAPAAFGAEAQAEASAPIQAALVQTQQASSEYGVFLKEKFNVTLSETPTRGEFIDAIARSLSYAPDSQTTVAFSDLSATSPYYASAAALYQRGILTSASVSADQPLSALQAVFIAVKAAGVTELAYSYPQPKVSQSLAPLALDVSDFVSLSAAQEIAAARDAGLVDPEVYGDLKLDANASKQLAEQLIGHVLEAQGQYKHYIGQSSDATIYAKLTDAYNTSDIIEAPELENIVNAALEQGLVTGYNLKDSRFNSNFVDSLSLTYGHSDLKHAIQLIGLLRSEGIEAKVQFEPKTSAFVHLIEWGQPTPSSTTHYKKLANGNYIALAKEYDIAFEFASAADKAKFQPVVLQYAKKNSEDTTGLIAGSWWQPLYYSLTELNDYDVITNNKITADGPYYAQSFSLSDKSDGIVAGFRQIDPNVRVSTYKFWVDRPFHNYLTGDDFK
ncbi:hypothetical protein N0M98_32390 [Paenibacillus doosanensis]|uniref:hypothetical protein n=1 Tax=Paenibacillus doosanensis TaxID=1229154 RepID=UPI0021807AE0|nr:hypothetical protein [Paenibacillus doosanensis]MCS7464783.1 hypothetical protein [Paenibacillus doosanensis]